VVRVSLLQSLRETEIPVFVCRYRKCSDVSFIILHTSVALIYLYRRYKEADQTTDATLHSHFFLYSVKYSPYTKMDYMKIIDDNEMNILCHAA